MRRIRNKLIAGGAAVLMGAAGLAALTGAAAPTIEVVKLSSAEAWALQQRVDQQLKNSVDGKQIGPNQVSYYDGTIIVTLVLPGEESARAVNNDFEVQASLCTTLGHACIYDLTNFAGDNALRVDKVNCEEINLNSIGWLNRVSAIHNNQTTNTQTLLLDHNRNILNANRAPSKINDLGVESGNDADYWRVC